MQKKLNTLQFYFVGWGEDGEIGRRSETSSKQSGRSRQAIWRDLEEAPDHGGRARESRGEGRERRDEDHGARGGAEGRYSSFFFVIPRYSLFFIVIHRFSSVFFTAEGGGHEPEVPGGVRGESQPEGDRQQGAGEERPTCSYQIKYLSNSIKLSKNIEPAMLSLGEEPDGEAEASGGESWVCREISPEVEPGGAHNIIMIGGAHNSPFCTLL